MATTKLEHALHLARQGFFVFPLLPNSKKPRFRRSFHEATRDEAQIEHWWTEGPNRNIGIAGGRGYFIIDVDVKDGKKGASSFMALQDEYDVPDDTFTVRTPTGGYHFYIKSDEPIGCNASQIAPDIDVRGQGGYVVAPGSTLDGVAYTVSLDVPMADCPHSFEAALPRYGAKKSVAALDSDALDELIDLPHNIDRAIDYLERADEAVEGSGGNTATYRVACRMRDLGLSPSAAIDAILDHYNPRCAPPWEPEDIERIVANAYRYSRDTVANATVEAVFAGAPLPDGVELGGASGAAMAASNDNADGVNSNPSRKRRKYNRVNLNEARSRAANPDRPYLIKGLLARRGTTVLYGPSNSGKTFIGLLMALCISQGIPFAGCRVKQERVVYVSTEGDEDIYDRLEALCRAVGLESYDPDMLHIITDQVDLYDPEADLRDLVDECREIGGAGLIILDTLARVMAGADENSGRDMSAFVRVIDTLRRHTDAHVLLVHHTGKDAARGARGHSALQAAIDTELEVSRDADDALRGVLKTTKQRKVAGGWSRDYELVPIPLGVDNEGDAITSLAAVVPEKGVKDTSLGAVGEGAVTDAQAVVLDVLDDTEGQGATVAEISREVDMTPSALRKHLSRMAKSGLVWKDKSRWKVKLDPRLVSSIECKNTEKDSGPLDVESARKCIT